MGEWSRGCGVVIEGRYGGMEPGVWGVDGGEIWGDGAGGVGCGWRGDVGGWSRGCGDGMEGKCG